jgi:hypothetical protein
MPSRAVTFFFSLRHLFCCILNLDAQAPHGAVEKVLALVLVLRNMASRAFKKGIDGEAATQRRVDHALQSWGQRRELLLSAKRKSASRGELAHWLWCWVFVCIWFVFAIVWFGDSCV